MDKKQIKFNSFERRVHPRLDCHGKRIHVEGAKQDDYVLEDISRGGVGILSKVPFPVGKNLYLKVSDEQMISIPVVVVHSLMVEVDSDLMEYAYLIGMSFSPDSGPRTWDIFYDILLSEYDKQEVSSDSVSIKESE